MKKITFLAAILATAVSFSQVAKVSFEEPAALGGQYTDTGDPNVAHDLVNNTGEPFVNFDASGDELGYNASYVPYDTPSDGLADGDFVGVTDFTPTGSDPYTDGVQGYQISDVDGNYILEFDAVDLTGVVAPNVTIDYFIAETGYEGDGTVNESGSDRLRIYVRDLTNSTEIDILNTEGNDINDLAIEGTWISNDANLLTDTTVQLVIEARTNASAEEFYFDNIVFGGTLGFADANTNTFSIYPNPVSGNYVNITSQKAGDIQVAVYDVLGKRVLNTVLTSERLNISNLNSGMYLVNLTQGNSTITKKLIVK